MPDSTNPHPSLNDDYVEADQQARAVRREADKSGSSGEPGVRASDQQKRYFIGLREVTKDEYLAAMMNPKTHFPDAALSLAGRVVERWAEKEPANRTTAEPLVLARALLDLEEQLRSREDALREVYELIYLGEPDNALHGLDAYMIREGIFRGEAASSPAKEPK